MFLRRGNTSIFRHFRRPLQRGGVCGDGRVVVLAVERSVALLLQRRRADVGSRSQGSAILAPCAGLEGQNSEASQGEVWRGRGFWEVEHNKDSIAFWHPAQIGLWATGHIDSTDGHLCPLMISLPLQNLWFSIGF